MCNMVVLSVLLLVLCLPGAAALRPKFSWDTLGNMCVCLDLQIALAASDVRLIHLRLSAVTILVQDILPCVQ